MMKNLRYLFSTLLLLMVAGVTWGQTVYYTLDTTDSSTKGTNSSYAGSGDVTVGGITWSVNGNAQMNPWRIGGKNLSDVDRTVYTKTAMGSAISKVTFTPGTISCTVNSLKLTVASDANFNTVLDEITLTSLSANTAVDFTPAPTTGSWAKDAYYKFTFNVNAGSSNQFVQFSKVEFYSSGTTPSGPVDPSVTFGEDPFTVKVGKTATNTISKPNDLTVAFASGNTGVATVDPSTGEVTGVAEGNTTITASWSASSAYNSGSASYTVNVVTPPAAVVYEKVTNANQLVAGNKYILVAPDEGKAMGAQTTFGTNNARLSVDVTVENDEVSITDEEVAILTLGGASGAWTFNASDNSQYLSWSSGNTLASNTTADANSQKWTVSDDFQLFNNSDADRRVAYNATNPRFAAYGNANQKLAVLFVKSGSSTSTKADPELAFAQTSVSLEVGQTTTIAFTKATSATVNFDNSEPSVATYNEATGEVEALAAGTTTITATSEENDNYTAGSATLTITVTEPLNLTGSGTAADPYTVADAITLLNAGQTPQGVYVQGIVSQIDEVSTTHGNATYWISDDGATTTQMEVYRGKYLDGANFTSEDQIHTGDVVVVFGNLTLYGSNNIPEFSQGNNIFSITSNAKQPADIAWNPAGPIEITSGESLPTITFVNNNQVSPIKFGSSNEAVAMWDEDNEEMVLMGGTGTAVIIATFDGDNNYEAAAATLTITVNEPAKEYYLRGINDDWSANDNYKFTKNDADGSYVLANVAIAANDKFKITEGNDWYGSAASENYWITAANHTDIVMTTDNSNPNYLIPTAGTYTFIIKTDATGALTLTVTGWPEPKYWLRGSFDTNDAGWGNGVEFTYNESTGTYTATQAMTNGTTFKVVKTLEGESDEWYGGYTGDANHYFIHKNWRTDIPLSTSGNDFEVTLTADATLTFTLDANNMKFTVTGWPTEPVVGAEKYVLVTSANELADGDEIIFVGQYQQGDANDGYYSMNNASSNNNRRGSKIVCDGTWATIVSDVVPYTLVQVAEPNAIFWQFKDADGKYLTSVTTDNNYLKLTENPNDNAKAAISFEAGTTSVVFQGDGARKTMQFNENKNNDYRIFACYTGATQKPVAIYKKTVITSVDVTIGATGYATMYYGDMNLVVPEGVVAKTYTVNDGLKESTPYVATNVIPAGTGVVLEGAQGTYTFNVTLDNGNGNPDNKLTGTDEETTIKTAGYKYYILSLDKSGTKVGFYFQNEDGSAVINGAHKAYLAVPVGATGGAKGWSFDGDATGINTISTDVFGTDGKEVYNLSGVRVSGKNLQKGIYIVNGKKVVIK